MIKTLSNSGIITNDTIQAGHVTQSINALTGTEAYEITISGSLLLPGTIASGSFIGDGTGLTGITAEWDGSHVGNASITGSLTVTGGVSGSFSGSFEGDGTNITGVTAEWDGSHNGNASITGSLTVTSDISSSNQVYGSRLNAAAYVLTPQINGVGGDIIFSNGLNITGNITSSGDISSSADVYGVTGSFQHLLGDGSQITGVTGEWDGSHVGNASITGSLTVTGGVSGSVSLSDGQTIEALNGNGQLDLRASNTDGVIVLNTSASNYASSYLYMTPGLSGEVYLQGQNANNSLSLGNNEINIATENELIFSGSSIRPFGILATDLGANSRPFKTTYSVTGSFLHLEGNPLLSSTINVKDPITFQSSITASSDISSSGTVYGVTGSFSHLQGNSPITVQDSVTFQSAITASNDILLNGNIIQTDGYALYQRNSAADLSVFNVRQLGTGPIAEFGSGIENEQIVINLGGHITASGDIISSGTVYSVTGSFSEISSPINFQTSASFTGLPTTEPTTTGSVWISGSSVAHPNSGYLMIFNP